MLAFRILLLILAALLAALAALRTFDARADGTERARLIALQPAAPQTFDPAMVADLPEPVRRYFNFVIAPGAPLFTVATFGMTGQFSLGDKDSPNYQWIEADQVLAAPEGFVWSMRTVEGLPVSGSDAGGWTRFRVLGFAPVARMGGDSDHARSAFGRFIAEATFWTPAALLPAPGIEWSSPAPDTARVTVTRDGMTQTVDLLVDERGAPVEVSFVRWSNANSEKRYREQPFGGYLSDYRAVGGFRIPHHVEAGNMFGTEDYFPFFIVDIGRIEFPQANI